MAFSVDPKKVWEIGRIPILISLVLLVLYLLVPVVLYSRLVPGNSLQFQCSSGTHTPNECIKYDSTGVCVTKIASDGCNTCDASGACTLKSCISSLCSNAQLIIGLAALIMILFALLKFYFKK